METIKKTSVFVELHIAGFHIAGLLPAVTQS